MREGWCRLEDCQFRRRPCDGGGAGLRHRVRGTLRRTAAVATLVGVAVFALMFRQAGPLAALVRGLLLPVLGLALLPRYTGGFVDFYLRGYLGLGGRPAGWAGHWPDMNFGHAWFIEHLPVSLRASNTPPRAAFAPAPASAHWATPLTVPVIP